ncbi:endonuclease, partial [Streptococcus suis]
IFLNQKKEVFAFLVIFNGENRPIISEHFGVEVEINV